MKRITYIVLPLLFFTSFLYSQKNHDSHIRKNLPNDVYKKIKISNPSPELMNKLGSIGLDLDCGSQFDSNGDLLIEVSTYEASKINKITSYQVVIDDMENFYAKRAVKNLPQAKVNLRTEKLNKIKSTNKSTSLKATSFGNITHRFEKTEIDWTVPTNFQLGASFGGCLTVDETNAQLDLMRSLYPNLITAKANASPTNQLTIGGRPVYVVKISNSNITGTKPQTLYTGMTHSREVSSLMNLTYFMWYLLENYATDPDVKNLVDNHELYFIPIVNPDGLAYNQQQAPTGGGMQRKNRRVTGTVAVPCSIYLDGIDLNRNWGTYWGYDDQGSSPAGCDDTYRGTAGFSEAETTSIKDFFLLHNFKTSVNHHAYKNAALHGRAAFYHTNNNTANAGVPNGRENEYYQYSHDMTQYSRYAYGSSPNISYWNNGNCNDWMSEGSGKNTLCWTPENGAPTGEGGFWPLPSQIPTIAKRAMRMNFIAGFYSGVYAKLHDLTKSDISTTSGALSFGLERVGQTDGNFTLTVTPISSNILSVTNVAEQSGMTVLEQRNLGVNFTLSPTIAAKEKIVFEVTLSNGTYIIYKTRLEKYYNPTSLFTSLVDPTTLTGAGWTASGTASWAITTTDGFGGTAGITTNTAAAYASAITTANLTQTAAISLAGKQQVAIQFNAKWDLERSFDYVQLQGSPDGGTTWIAMDGKYTKPGTTTSVTDYTTTLATTSKTTGDKAFQPDGLPIYDGDKFDKWVLEEYYISATENSGLFNKASVKFRFIFRTDSNNRAHGYNTTFKGFRFDNFKILEIKSSPPVAICKNAALSLNSAGSLTVLPVDVNDGSSDDIGITAITVSPNTFNCSHANTTQAVTLSVTDADGQISTCVASVTITVPEATITTISPNTAISGETAFTLTVNGSNFVNGQSLIRWNGANRTSTFVSANQLTASISAADISSSGTANVTVFNSCSSIATVAQTFTITTNCSSTTTWNGTTWSNGAPTSSTTAIIAGNYNVSTNISACTLTVNNNAVVSIPSGYNVTLNGAITVSSGSFTLNNNANLIQTSNAANSGNIIVKRNSSALMRLDYTAWSSPVTNNTSLFLQSFSPATSSNRFYNYTTSTNLYTEITSPATTNFALGKGYLIRISNNHPTTPTVWNGSFTGVPNNGIIPITMTNGGVGKRFNLVGNPYPSTISMTQFVADNNTKITGTLYFWRKTNGLTNPTYCTWVNGVFTSNGGAQVVNPNGIIQTGQGFFVEALNSATSVTFNNGQRIANNANQFFKTKVVERSTIWLNATNSIGNFSQMALSYVSEATQGVDDFDGKYYNDGAIALNSVLDNTDYVIQGRALPFDGTDEVPLSFKATNPGNYTIAIDHVEGLFSGSQDIILKDNETGTETNLKNGGYTFSAPTGATNSRFSLKYQKTLGTNTVVFDENSLVVFKKNGNINIKSNGTFIDNVKLYDIRGRLLFEKTKVNANETSIESLKYANQVLIVQITSNDNKVINKKVAN
ncbi:T9SS sorting signal type C domain-containing protein [Flavobacterium franklandianum]|uniref:M14 family zinc carboxypeptidase n=1 Tax=Flavobacterium franklandianum TaxID=2594430 RepID=UPI001179C787|nr:M14 family zinc carboxypeptidase [Flavobacterium franklandianum]TRX27551.1 T9SS sorting signal type C domain-containing protein [Flavobacterium franklandianum]